MNFVEDTEKGDFDQTLSHQFETIKKLTSRSHVMQWGDLSYQSEAIGNYMSGPSRPSNNLRFLKPIRRMGTKNGKESVMNSRTMKLQSLSAIYAREKSPETLAEMVDEIASMKKFDTVFKRVEESLGVSGQYDAYNINFDCLRATVDGYETKCGKFTDYGLDYIKYLAHACESKQAETILDAIKC